MSNGRLTGKRILITQAKDYMGPDTIDRLTASTVSPSNGQSPASSPYKVTATAN